MNPNSDNRWSRLFRSGNQSLNSSYSKTALPNSIAKYQTYHSYSNQKKSGRHRKKTLEMILSSNQISQFPTNSCKKWKNSSCFASQGYGIAEWNYQTFFHRLDNEFQLRFHKLEKQNWLWERKRSTPGIRQKDWTLDKWIMERNIMFSVECPLQQFVMHQHYIKWQL